MVESNIISIYTEILQKTSSGKSLMYKQEKWRTKNGTFTNLETSVNWISRFTIIENLQ